MSHMVRVVALLALALATAACTSAWEKGLKDYEHYLRQKDGAGHAPAPESARSPSS